MANPLALKALRLAGKGIKSVVKKLKSKSQTRQGLKTPESVDVFHKGHKSVYGMENRAQRQMGATKMRSTELTMSIVGSKHRLNMSQKSKAIKAATPLNTKKKLEKLKKTEIYPLTPWDKYLKSGAKRKKK